MDSKTLQRRYDLDWLRVLGILFVFIYHSSRLYNVEDWAVKNEIWYPLVEVWNGFATSFMMPLMFVISGASLFYAMGKDGFGKFFKDKILRLLVPLLVAVLTHISIQAYLDNKTHGLFSGNYFQFLPQYYNLDTINWLGAHLWYLWYLFLFSIVLYPLMRWLKGASRGFLTRLDGILVKTVVLYTLTFPFLLLYSLIDSDSPLMASNGGYPYIMYLWLLLLGFLITSDQRIQDRIHQLRWVSLTAGLVLSAGFAILYNLTADKETISPSLVLAVTMRVFGGWLSVLGILGLGMQYLTKRTARLDYASEAVLPFYILHQTVLMAVAYFVLQWSLPEVLEWAAIVVISFGVIMVIYEYLVRRWNVMRVLFGMKPLARPVGAETKETQLKEAIRTM
ncbi:MAG TPA: acyltransferase [Anaerolineales bacterium]|nr:acyltransferase [Anaerolineales bacterium]